MPSIFCKRRDLFFVGFYPFGRFRNCILFMGRYIRIYWVDGCKGFKKERVTLRHGSRHHVSYWHRRAWGRITCVRTYIYRHIPYRQPPLYQGLGSRVSKGHRVTGSQGYQIHRSTDPQSHGDARSRRRKVTGSRGHIITWSLSHWVTGLSITRVYLHDSGLQGLQGHRVIQVLGSHDHWVTRYQGNQVTRYQGHPASR